MPPKRALVASQGGGAGNPRGTGNRATEAKRKSFVSIDSGVGMVWRGSDYPILAPGIYTVRGTNIQGPVWLRNYMRWSLRVEFALVHDSESVSAFFNFGNNREQQQIGRQSRYYRAWTIANGEHPRKGQRMSPDVFLEGQFFEVEVETCGIDAEGQTKQDAEVYSRITKIISARWP